MDVAKTVLVVDDDLAIRHLLEEYLLDAGYQVQLAADGRAALALVAQSRPDLLLVDLTMPRMSGWDLMRELAAQESTASIPIILLSASREIWAAAARYSVAACFDKPLELDEIVEKIGEILYP